MTTQRFSYSQIYQPSAPVLEIAVASIPESLRSPFITALVDTGADATVLPLSMLRAINARVVDIKTLRSYTGDSRRVRTFLVDVIAGDLVIPGIEVVGDVVQEAILGRDVLNKLNICLYGPKEELELME